VHEGLYESLLTERLHQVLGARPDLHADIDSVDDAEQPLTIARHLTLLIDRSLRATSTPEDRAELVRRILATLPDPELMLEALHQREPSGIERLDAIARRTYCRSSMAPAGHPVVGCRADDQCPKRADAGS
jgi:hypothetical protein